MSSKTDADRLANILAASERTHILAPHRQAAEILIASGFASLGETIDAKAYDRMLSKLAEIDPNFAKIYEENLAMRLEAAAKLEQPFHAQGCFRPEPGLTLGKP